MPKDNFKAYLAYTSICIFWGTTYLAIKIGVSEIPPFLFVGMRWFAAGTILTTYFILRGKKFPDIKELMQIALTGICLIGIANALLSVAEQWLPSGISSLIITTIPFWIVGMEAFLPSGPKLNSKIILGLLLGLVGVALIVAHNLHNLSSSSYIAGILALVGSMLAWSFGSVYSKYKKFKVDLFFGVALEMLIAGVVQLGVGIILGEGARFHIDEKGIFAVVYLMVFGSIFGYSSYIYAINHLPLSFVSTYAYVNPVIALVLGWLVLGEEMNWIIVLAAIVIFAGVTIVRNGTISQNRMQPQENIPAQDIND